MDSDYDNQFGSQTRFKFVVWVAAVYLRVVGEVARLGQTARLETDFKVAEASFDADQIAKAEQSKV